MEEILTGITLGLLDKRSRDVTWRVWSSVHRTSSVNSTEHSGQKSSQVQSYRKRAGKHFVFKVWFGQQRGDAFKQHWGMSLTDRLECTHPGVLHFVYDVITCERYQTWWHGKQQCRDRRSELSGHILLKKRSDTPWYTPTLWATNSSCSTDELASIWIQSIAASTGNWNQVL